MNERHLNALDLLSNGASPAIRRDAANQLFGFEQTGEISESDLLEMLSGDDLVVRSHAVRALGEIKSQQAAVPLIKLFKQSKDPLLLQELLEAFVLIGGEAFLPAVLGRICPSTWARWLQKIRAKNNPDPLFDEPFIIEQILLDVLKYLQICPNVKFNRTLKALVNHDDPMIRLNCLRLYGKIGSLPANKTLERLQTQDPHPLVRQQATLMAQQPKE